MNILQINTVDSKGGAARVAYSLKNELEKRGHEAPMFVGRKYSDEKNIKLLNNIRSFSGKIRRKLSYWLANDIDIFCSNHILKTQEFKNADIIHCHNLHSYYFNLSTLIKISRLKPVIWTFHDMWPITAHCAHAFDGTIQNNGFFACPSLDIFPPIAWHNEKYLEIRKRNIYIKSKFNIVTPSRWLADKIGQSILNDKPISVIYNGIDTSVFKPYNRDKSRQELGLPQDKHIILVVAKGGASNPWKGGNYAQGAIEAFKGDSRAFFVDLGGNASHTTDQVKVVSFVADQALLAKYYSAADTLLYPSIADNCPLVVLEAMACGLPVISFSTGGIPELIDHKKTVYIARYKDAVGLANGITWMLMRTPTEHTAMRESAVIKIRSEFTLNYMTEQYLELYKSILKK